MARREFAAVEYRIDKGPSREMKRAKAEAIRRQARALVVAMVRLFPGDQAQALDAVLTAAANARALCGRGEELQSRLGAIAHYHGKTPPTAPAGDVARVFGAPPA
jgi:hypothetical protein